MLVVKYRKSILKLLNNDLIRAVGFFKIKLNITRVQKEYTTDRFVPIWYDYIR